MWVESVLKKEGVIPNGVLVGKSLPECENPLETLVGGLRELTQSNFNSAVFVLGKCMYL